MRKGYWRIARAAAPLAAVVGVMLGANAAFAATGPAPNVSFAVLTTVGIASTGQPAAIAPIDPGSATPTRSTTGGFTLSSTDLSGFQLTAVTPAATVAESGTSCTPAAGATAAVGVLSVGISAVGGSIVGTAGTPATPITLSTTAQNLYTAVPTRIGTSLTATATYTVTPGYTTPANSTGCGYTIPVTVATVAK